MISLRPHVDGDVERLQVLANNKNVSKYLAYTFPYPYTLEDAKWWIESGQSENGAVTRVIEYNREFVGVVGITPQTGWRDHIAEIGYWVGEPYWGNGIATAALEQMTDVVFSAATFRKLLAPVLAPNTPSMRVLEKCGYELAAILKAEVHKDGEFYDIYQYARYRSQ
jgi:RimJ/RimL family protein N-acetyltransferase